MERESVCSKENKADIELAMRVNHIIDGLMRRVSRFYYSRYCLSQRNIDRREASAILFGYRLRMSYPDRLIWLYQFKEIFCDDCYQLNGIEVKNPVIFDIGSNITSFVREVEVLPGRTYLR